MMGAGSTEPLYSYCSLDNFQRADTLPVRYFWIDRNIASEENQLYLAKFKEEVDIYAFNNLLSFQ